MSDEGYFHEVSRQSDQPLRPGELQEFRYFMEMVRGTERNKKRRTTRLKMIAGAVATIGAITSMWDWVARLLFKVGGH